MNWFDHYGVYVQGASDHLVFANMEADSMIPQGTQPLGFYVNERRRGQGTSRFITTEAHMNYDGFRLDGFTYNSSQFTGTGTPITMVNDKAYANRDGALVDNTGPSNGTGAVTYSSCHFYASSLAVAGSTDVEATSGRGQRRGSGIFRRTRHRRCRRGRDIQREVTLTVDDEGMTQDADSYYATTVLPVADAAGVPVGAAITVGYSLAQTLVPSFRRGSMQGRDLTSHSISHTYYTNTDALDIQIYGDRDGGVVEHQRPDADDYGDGRERHGELQPGAGPAAGNDLWIGAGAHGDGTFYGDGKSGRARDRMGRGVRFTRSTRCFRRIWRM